MPYLLKELELVELSIVDKPANPMAKAPLFKRDSKGDIEEMEEEVIKMSEDMKAKLKPYMDKGMSAEEAMKAYEEDMKKSADALKVENERLRKALIENEFVIKADSIEKKAPVEYIEVEGEQILKSEIPAPILKRLEQAEIEKAEAEVAKKAEQFSNIKTEVAKKLILKNLLEDEELLEFLRAVDAMFAKAMDEQGETQVNGDMGDPREKIKSLAKAYQAEKGVTYEQAYTQVALTQEGQALVKAMKKESE
jgi:hypothetical protein